MNLPENFTKVTRLSKTLALILFIILPSIGFYLGTLFQKQITPKISPETRVVYKDKTAENTTPIPTVTPTVIEENSQKIFDKFTIASQVKDPEWLDYKNDYCGLKLSYPPAKSPYSHVEMKEGFRDWKVSENMNPNLFNNSHQILIYAPIAIDVPATGISEIYAIKLECNNNLNNINLDQYFQKISKAASGTNKISKINIYGNDAYVIKVEKEGEPDLFSTAIIFTNGKYSYTLQIGVETTDPVINANINKVLNSIEFI
jgi:hypothetical protein